MSPPPVPPARPGMWFRLRARYTDRQLSGAGLSLVAFLITAGLAVWGSSSSPPKLVVGLLLTVLAGAFQTGAAWLFSHGQGTAQSNHAQSSVGSLLRLYLQVQALKANVERIVRKRGASEIELRQGLGVVSTSLEFISERAVESVGHWDQFYPEAVTKARTALEEERSG